MTAARHEIIVASVLERRGLFLCVEERVDGAPRLGQPEGILRLDETPMQGAARVTREESGYTFLPVYLVGIYQYYDPAIRTVHLRLVYTGVVFEAEGLLTQPSDPGIHAIHWLTYEQLERVREKYRSPFVLQCVDDYLLGKQFPLDIITHYPASHALRSREERI